jgi:hypothetical protein
MPLAAEAFKLLLAAAAAAAAALCFTQALLASVITPDTAATHL